MSANATSQAASPPNADDLRHLRILSVFHYVLAGIAGLVCCFYILHMILAPSLLRNDVEMQLGKYGQQSEVLSQFVSESAGMIMVFDSVFLFLFLGVLVCLLLAARNLSRRRRYTFCLVVAGLSILFVPFGTILGVFAIVVLMRDSVRSLFRQQAAGLDRPEGAVQVSR